MRESFWWYFAIVLYYIIDACNWVKNKCNRLLGRDTDTDDIDGTK